MASVETTLLVIIDPQNDFHPAGDESSYNGSLAVAGAVEDARKLAAFLSSKNSSIDDIVVTMDTHQKYHIAHPNYWKDKNGAHLPPFTAISAENIKDGTWSTVHEDCKENAIKYAETLEKGQKFSLFIWPFHCIAGTPGHNVHPIIMDALNNWADTTLKPIEYVFKGTNAHTEMYSALKAEVENSDPATQLNTTLLNKMKSYDRVIFCGQARSHCVNWTVRDFVANGGDASKVVLLADCQSSVAGFDELGKTFFNDLREMGATITNSTEL